MSSSTTTFVYRVESDRALLSAVARMYAESKPDGAVTTWREQLRWLITRYGREVVVETLTEEVPGLTMRHAVTLVDLAQRVESGRLASV